MKTFHINSILLFWPKNYTIYYTDISFLVLILFLIPDPPLADYP